MCHSADSVDLTVIILTRNEEANIAECLRSVAWANDVVVLDSGSTDGTVARARETCPNVRVFQHPFRDFGAQRNWALEHADPRHEWVLFLDADERCPAALARTIREIVSTPGETAGYYLACRGHFLGRWIRHCTMYPSWQLRLLRQGEVRFRKEGHGQREITSGRLGYIREPYDHHLSSHGIEHWIARHNRYSTEEVELIERLVGEPLSLRDLFGDAVRRRRCVKRLAARTGLRPWLRFLYLYVLRRGFLDGRPGLIFCLLHMAYEIQITAKLAERRGARPDVQLSR